MPFRPSRRQVLTGVGACAGLAVVVGALAFGPVVRGRVASEAARRHLVVTVGAVRPGWFAVECRDIGLQPEGVGSVHVHVDVLRVGLGLGLGVRHVELRGAQVALAGSPETIRDDWRRWRGEREPAAHGGGSTVAVDATGVSLQWRDAQSVERGAELRGMAMSHDATGTRAVVTDGWVHFDQESLEWTEASVQLDAAARVLRAHAASLGVGWQMSSADSPSQSGASASSEPPPAPTPQLAKIARAARGSKRNARPSAPLPVQPPSDAGSPLVPLPDLRAARGRAQVLSSVLAEYIQAGADLGVDALTWKLSQGADGVALTFGPGPLSLTRTPSQLEIHYSTESAQRVAGVKAVGTPLALRVVLPTDASDLVTTVEGGPVSLSLLGVKEEAAGLVNVDRATVIGRARVVLAGDGSTLTVDVDGSARGVSVNQPRLALETVRDLDVGVRARGVLTREGEVRVDDFAATLGALRLTGSGSLDQKPDHVSGAAQLEIPTEACQSLLSSIPSALLPALAGTKMAGTFGARAHFAFDSRSLDDLDLKYDIQDRCHLVQVSASLDRDRFQQPFEHRVYLPDGSTADETTGPGTPNWTALDQISPFMQVAVLTTEDGAFPKHHGYNHAAIRASIIANLKARRFVRGASTITMQLAKNLFLPRDKTLSRKLEEVVLTDYLEQTFSKDEILELYLNVIEFGPSVYGITAAAEFYFGRAPAELSLGECLFLSSILPAPLRYSGMREHDQPPDGWVRTLHMLMEIAHKRGLLTDAELAQGESEPILFWHGGDRPAPRAPVRARTPAALDGSEVPDPFEPAPESQ